jgi:rfaE bifunctional protein nucleotidyltransferase chain/domain
MVTAPILSLDAAAGLAAGWRGEGRKIVAVSGSFDILHGGHRNLLSEARAAAGALIVLVNSDASVRAYKGPGRPINKQEARVAAVAALPGVDAVLLFEDIVPLRVIATLKPDIVANGPEYGADCIERALVESYGGQILVTSPRSVGNSTSNLARRMGVAPNPRAILLDRDGTLIEDPGYLSRPDGVVWRVGAMEALKRLGAAGYRLIIATNQSGLGRGLFTLEDMERVHRRIRDDLSKAGVMLDGLYYCPHRPEENCACRKPGTGMPLAAAREHGLDLSKSWLIGDKCSDITAGRMANMLTALVHSSGSCLPGPHLRAGTLAEAADLILARD